MSSKYEMWMTFNNNAERLQFPVLPERINIRKRRTNQSISVQGLGEVVVMQDDAAVMINFSSFFPKTPFPGVQYENLLPPEDIKDMITIWQKADRPVRFLVTGTTINLPFTIEDFSYNEQGGDIGALHYSLSLKEYRFVKTRRVELEGNAAVLPEPTVERADNRQPEPVHTVVSGDNLSAIARRNGTTWQAIFELNRDIISNPNMIHPGWVLRMPA